MRHGAYSTQLSGRIMELVADHEQNPDPLNVLPELARARAILDHWLQDYDHLIAMLQAWYDARASSGDLAPSPRKLPSPQELIPIVDTISKIVHRIQSRENAQHIGRSTFLRIMGEMGRVVQANVLDEEARARIKEGWLRIRMS